MRQLKNSTTKHAITARIKDRKDGGCLEKRFGSTAGFLYLTHKKHVMVLVVKEF